MQQLTRKTTGKKKELPLKIMQFGGGNFLRAFVDWMIDVLNNETDFRGGVAIIKPTGGGDYKDLKDQQGLFTVILKGIENGKLITKTNLVGSVQKVVNPYTDWQDYLDLAKMDSLRFIISNTTEAGIAFNSSDTYNATPPHEFPAKLTLWLYHRFLYFKGDESKGCIHLPCELIEKNGDTLRSCVLEYVDHWQMGGPFKDWILKANYFCNTLVDRIVSGYPKDQSAMIQKELGYEDRLLVVGEIYHNWIIQAPEKIQEELPFAKTKLNVRFVDDLVPYREMKVRFLNGAHTAIVPIAYLSGLEYVQDVMEDISLRSFMESLLHEEIAKTLNFPDTLKNQYIDDVLTRFANPTLKHKLISISLNGTSKFTSRLLPTIKDYYRLKGRLPNRILLSLAAMILFYQGKRGDESIPLADNPEVLDLFSGLWADYAHKKIEIPELVHTVLGSTSIWGEDLTKLDGLTENVARNLKILRDKGVRECLSANSGRVKIT